MIPVSQPNLSGLERAYLLDAFDSGWISSRGPYIERAESALRERVGATCAAVTSNGTTALHLALLALGIGAGDEVIIPSLTYVATLNSVLYTGATPVVVDVDADTWCIDPGAVERAITGATAGILAVDLFGHPAPYGELRSVVGERPIPLIADAAESFGGCLDGRPVGTLADVTIFSFFGNKVITSGEGGAVVTNSRRVHETVLSLRNQGNSPAARYHHDRLGYNYRMTNLEAAVLLAQLERSEELLDQRRRVVARYRAILDGVPGLHLQGIAASASPAPWLLSVRIDGADAPRRDRVMEFMAAQGIETRPMFLPVQEMPYFADTRSGPTPVSETIAHEGLSLPTYPGLSAAQIGQVTRGLRAAVAASGSTGV